MRSVSRRPDQTRAVVVDGDSVAFPVVDPENFVRLAEESLQVYSTLLWLNPSYGDVVADREFISSTSGLISRDATSPMRLSSAEAAASMEVSHQVLSPHYISPFLRLLVDRLHRSYRASNLFFRGAYGSDFIPTPSSLNRASSLTWNSLIYPWATHLLDLRISGRQIIMASRYASRHLGEILLPTWRGPKRYYDYFYN
jgi:hypothetical protein